MMVMVIVMVIVMLVMMTKMIQLRLIAGPLTAAWEQHVPDKPQKARLPNRRHHCHHCHHHRHHHYVVIFISSRFQFGNHDDFRSLFSVPHLNLVGEMSEKKPNFAEGMFQNTTKPTLTAQFLTNI